MEPGVLVFTVRWTHEQNPHKARHVHRHHEFLYCLSGRGVQLTERGEESCTPGDLFFFPAGSGHLSYVPAGRELQGLVVALHEGFFSPGLDADRPCLSVLAQLRRDAAESCRVGLSEAGSAAAGAEFRALAGEFESRRPGRECALKLRLSAALLAVLRDPEFRLERANALAPLSRRALVDEVLWYLRRNYMRPVKLAEVLALTAMSRSHFHAVFREAAGQTLSAALRQVRLDKAKEMLRDPQASILEVALDCGFGSQSHFCHAFKAATGLPPRQWRAEQPPLPETTPATGRGSA